ncbi:MAG: amidinotransferase [Syntrophus sp. (in: bacteria)]|nr:amidinotransferase [Syntrophus sp. (in: bacteria)]
MKMRIEYVRCCQVSCAVLWLAAILFLLLPGCQSIGPYSAGMKVVDGECAAPVELSLLHPGSIQTGSAAEWLSPKTVIVHTPGDEVFLGLTHPAAALFERPFSLDRARQEHSRFICLLNKHGARVYRLIDILLAGTINDRGDPLAGEALSRLRELAFQALQYDTSALTGGEAATQNKYKEEVIASLHPVELIKIILQQPLVRLETTEGHNTGFKATYWMDPVMNLYFMRDQVMTTAKGLVVGHFNAVQREMETKIVRFAYTKLGITPIFEVYGNARLEGGDFIPAGEAAFIGQGLRTNGEAIKQLLDAQVFGTKWVVVVKDPWKNQDQMHLDTYFNIIDKNLAVLVEERMDVRDERGRLIKSADPGRRAGVDVYELGPEGYRKQISNADFQVFLEKNRGFRLIPVSNADQLKYGINFLSMGKRKILAIDGVSLEYKARLAQEGVEVTWMDFSNLTGGYGAAHCTTQVIRRE